MVTVGTRSSSNHRLPLVPGLTIRQIAGPSPFMRARRSTVAVVILALAAVASACASIPPPVPLPPAPGAGPEVPTEAFDVRAGIEQIYVTGAVPGGTVRLSSSDGGTVSEGVADRFGSFVFRQLQQGRTYSVADVAADRSRTVRVLTVDDHTVRRVLSVDLIAGRSELPPHS
jgi:hypothetical protein